MLNDYEQGQLDLIKEIKRKCKHLTEKHPKDDLPEKIINLLVTLQPIEKSNSFNEKFN